MEKVSMADYVLYSDRKANRHVFIRTEDGTPQVIASEEMRLENEDYPSVMDCHHGLVRFMFEVALKDEEPDGEAMGHMEGILRVPFDKMNGSK